MFEKANRDITYCQGLGCKKKWSCKRYLGLYKLVGNRLSITSGEECVKDNYDLYLELENYD